MSQRVRMRKHFMIYHHKNSLLKHNAQVNLSESMHTCQMKLLLVSFEPFYPSREISQISITLMYVLGEQ